MFCWEWLTVLPHSTFCYKETTRAAEQICWCSFLNNPCSQPRSFCDEHTVGVWWQHPEQTQRVSTCLCCTFYFPIESRRMFLLSTLYSPAWPEWVDVIRNTQLMFFVFLLSPLSVKPRVTFLSWRHLCPRGCERFSTGCRTAEPSAPRYTSSSKHRCTSGFTSDTLNASRPDEWGSDQDTVDILDHH